MKFIFKIYAIVVACFLYILHLMCWNNMLGVAGVLIGIFFPPSIGWSWITLSFGSFSGFFFINFLIITAYLANEHGDI